MDPNFADDVLGWLGRILEEIKSSLNVPEKNRKSAEYHAKEMIDTIFKFYTMDKKNLADTCTNEIYNRLSPQHFVQKIIDHINFTWGDIAKSPSEIEAYFNEHFGEITREPFNKTPKEMLCTPLSDGKIDIKPNPYSYFVFGKCMLPK